MHLAWVQSLWLPLLTFHPPWVPPWLFYIVLLPKFSHPGWEGLLFFLISGSPLRLLWLPQLSFTSQPQSHMSVTI